MKLNKFGMWGLSSLNGILMIGFGIIAIAFPSLTIAVISIYFAITIMAGGFILSLFAYKHRHELLNWKTRLTEGLLSLALGLVIVFNPQSAAAFLIIIVGLWALFIGVVFVVSYFSKSSTDIIRVFNLIAGLVSLVMGGIVVFNPFESSRFVVILIGIYALAFGIFTMVYSSKFIKSQEDDTDTLE
jgi:uncharacterized membrane protein HdeD (DUF308 family)